MNNQSPVKMGFLLLGSFILAYLGAEYVHELCHYGAALISGGDPFGIVVDPFGWSYCFSNSIEHPIFYIAAGAIGSSLIGILLFVLLIRWPRPLLLPLLLFGPIALINNGQYWAVDIIEGTGMDACRLVEMGIPASVLLVAGIIQCLIGVVFMIWLMRVIGLTNQPFVKRLIVLGVGIIPYALFGVIWNWANEVDILWLSTMGWVLLFTAIAGLFRAEKPVSFEAKWPVVLGFNVIGIGLVVGLLMMISFHESKASSDSSLFKSSSTRPDNFPDVLVPHPAAKDPFYMISRPIRSNQSYILRYSLPEDLNPEAIRDDLTTLLTKEGYVRLCYELDDPNKPLTDKWTEEITQAGFKKVQTREYKQTWIRLFPEISMSLLNVYYMWRGNTFQDAGVFSVVILLPESEEVLNYADMHPDAFNLIDLDWLRMQAVFKPEACNYLCVEGNDDNGS